MFGSISSRSARRLASMFSCLALTAVACGGTDSIASDTQGATPLPTSSVPVVESAAPPVIAESDATGAAPRTQDGPGEADQAEESGGSGEGVATPACTDVPAELRTDLMVSGNRVFGGLVAVDAEPVDIALGSPPVWVLPVGAGAWYVTLSNGTAVVVSADGSIASADLVREGAPPAASISDAGPVVVSAYANQGLFNDPLPDTRVVHDGQYSAALVSSTDRYGHGVLGDAIEAAAVEVLDRCTGMLTRVDIAAPSVIEGISPMLADLNADGTPEVVVTVSNADVGARLEAYSVGGEFVASSTPIGSGNRWRNQMGVAPLGPNGEAWLVDVRTPHIGGTVQFFALDGDELVLVANSNADYTSHVIGSRNLDMGLLADTTGDGRAEVLVLTASRDRIAVLEVTGTEVQRIASLDPGAGAVTNIAVQPSGAGSALAIGTSAGVLRVWAR